ncbi:MAG: 4'-phosphopantetheinyl transferase superfamily protein [Spirochaetales bacterium]|nr:4'-phosphopantetheinyl transferase superfamily protein [Spirochaetales bacterium]
MRLSIFPVKTLVGNDLVDLELPQAQAKFRDKRYVERVLTSSEIQTLAQAQKPHQMLCTFWAAKESCFKVLQKLDPNTVFSPRLLEVQGSPESSSSSVLHFQDRQLFVSWTWGEGWVHCLATMSLSYSPLFRVETFDSHQFSESEAVRNLGKKLFQELGWTEVQFRRVIRQDSRPLWPQAYLGSNLIPVDVSFSHDGRFVASALAW